MIDLARAKLLCAASACALLVMCSGCGRVGVHLLPLHDAGGSDGAPADASPRGDAATAVDSGYPVEPSGTGTGAGENDASNDIRNAGNGDADAAVDAGVGGAGAAAAGVGGAGAGGVGAGGAGVGGSGPAPGIRVIVQEPAGGSTLTNFPVRVELDTQTLINQGTLAADCSNLRVVGGTNCSAGRSFFLPAYSCNTTTTEIWVRVPQLLPGNSEVIAVTFDPAMGSPSSGAQVFPFFDDFDGTSIDSTRWTVHGQGTISVSAGILQTQGIMMLESSSNAVSAGASISGVRMAALGAMDTDVEFGVGRLFDESVIWAYGRDWDGVTFLSYDVSTYALNGSTSSSCNNLHSSVQPSIGSPWVDHAPATATFLTAEFWYANMSGAARASLRTSRGASFDYTAPAGCTLASSLPVLITLDHDTPNLPIQRVDYVYVRPSVTTNPSASVMLSSSLACGVSP